MAATWASGTLRPVAVGTATSPSAASEARSAAGARRVTSIRRSFSRYWPIGMPLTAAAAARDTPCGGHAQRARLLLVDVDAHGEHLVAPVDVRVDGGGVGAHLLGHQVGDALEFAGICRRRRGTAPGS